MKKYEHLFFDLDRTLWDFEANSEAALRGLFDSHDLQRKGVDNFDEFFTTYRKINEACWADYRVGGISKDQLRLNRFLKTFQNFGLDDAKLALRFGDDYIEESPKQKCLQPGAEEVIDYLAGKYYLHIITNGFKEVQHIKLKNCGLLPYFSEVIISEEEGQKKPHRLVFDRALERARARETGSLMVGDDLEADVIGARNAGWDQIYYNPGGLRHTENVTFEIQHLNELKKFL